MSHIQKIPFNSCSEDINTQHPDHKKCPGVRFQFLYIQAWCLLEMLFAHWSHWMSSLIFINFQEHQYWKVTIVGILNRQDSLPLSMCALNVRSSLYSTPRPRLSHAYQPCSICGQYIRLEKMYISNSAHIHSNAVAKCQKVIVYHVSIKYIF